MVAAMARRPGHADAVRDERRDRLACEDHPSAPAAGRPPECRRWIEPPRHRRTLRRAAVSAISLKTATRAADRLRSSLISLARMPPRARVMASETTVMTMSRDSIPFNPSIQLLCSPGAFHLAQPELHRDFDQHIDRRPESASGRESPLPDRLNGALVESGAQALNDANRTDTTVASDDDLEHHVAREAASPRLFGVVGLDLLQDRRRRDPAARTIGPATGSATRAVADAWPSAFDRCLARVRCQSPRPRRPPGCSPPVGRARGRLPAPWVQPARSRRAPGRAESGPASPRAAAVRPAVRRRVELLRPALAVSAVSGLGRRTTRSTGTGLFSALVPFRRAGLAGVG